MPTPPEDQRIQQVSRQADRPGDSTPRSGSEHGLNPAALSVTATARLLARVGGRSITEAMIERDIEDGAPTNADGTINLVHFAAWLVRDMSQRAAAGGDDCGN